MKGIDPIEELHRIRWQICKKAGGTPVDYFRHHYEMDKKIFGESNAAEAAASGKSKTVQRKPCRKSAKPAARGTIRKSGQRREAVMA